MGGSTKVSQVKYDGIIVQSALLGITIPYLWGTAKVGCNLIDYQDFNSKQVSSGGKGGGSPKQYNYYATLVMAICVGPIAGVRTIYKDNAIFTATAGGSKEVNGTTVTYSSKTPVEAAGLSALFLGTANQAPWSYMQTAHPANALGYQLIALALAENYNLDSSATPPNHNFEVQSAVRSTINGVQIDDALISDILPDMVQHIPRWPSSGALGDLTVAATYCAAQGLWGSPVADNGRQGSDILAEILKFSNCDAFWSNGQLQIAPYGDTAITANGVTYTPNLSPIYALTWDDIIPSSSGEDPIQWDVLPTSEAFNYQQLTFNDRALQYSDNIATATDQANITTYTRMQGDPVSLESVCDAGVAKALVQLLVQRTANLRRTGELKVFETFGLLDPMDLVSVPLRNGGTRLVRIIEANEADDGSIDLKVEEMLVGSAHAPTYTRQDALGEPVNFDVAPGDCDPPVIINPPTALTGGNLEIWLGTSGGPTWGGANVWVSLDNVNYSQVGVITAPARYGITTNDFPAAADPDTTQTLGVNLATSGGALASGSTADADANTTLCSVGTEVIAYSTATPTGGNTYSLSGYIRRGQAGTTIADQPIASQFMRLDDGVFEIEYPASMVGYNLYVKLQPFNIYGGGLVDLDLTPYYVFTCAKNGPTVGEVTWSNVSGTGKPADNATVGAITGVNLESSTYGVLNDSNVVTAIGTANAIVNQTGWATYGSSGNPGYSPLQVTTPGANLLYNASFTLGKDLSTGAIEGLGVSLGSAVVGINSGVGLNMPYLFTGANYSAVSRTVNCSPGQSLSLSTWIYAGGISAGWVRFYIQFLNSSGSAVGYSAVCEASAGAGWTYCVQPNNIAPDGTASWQAVFDTTNAAQTANSATFTLGQGVLWTQPKVEIGTTVTPWNDYATNGAAYPNGAALSYLQPAEGGSDVTSTHTANAIYGQGALALLNSVSYGSGYLTGFGAIATQTSVSYGSTYLTGFGALAPLNVVNTGLSGQLNSAAYGLLEDSAIYTALGTANAITGQGALATLNSVTTGSNVYSPTYGSLSDSQLVTSLGTANAITGQGSLATVSSIAYGGPYVSGFGYLASQATVQTGGSGSGQLVSLTYGYLSDSGIYTAIGTANTIASQGALATLNSVSSSYLEVGSIGEDYYIGYSPTVAVSPGGLGSGAHGLYDSTQHNESGLGTYLTIGTITETFSGQLICIEVYAEKKTSDSATFAIAIDGTVVKTGLNAGGVTLNNIQQASSGGAIDFSVLYFKMFTTLSAGSHTIEFALDYPSNTYLGVRWMYVHDPGIALSATSGGGG